MKRLTDNHIKIEVGSKVTFPPQNKVWFGEVVEILDGMLWENRYKVQTVHGDILYFTGQDFIQLFPVVGMGGTWSSYSDSHPVTVTAISKSGRKIAVRSDAHKPVPNSQFAENSWELYEDLEGVEYEYKFNKKGKWVLGSRSLFLGYRRYYHDYQF